VRPFLKWAGGKRQLLPALRAFYPASFDTYFEPFVGSGAVFFDLVSRGALEGRAAVLSDVNPDVIGCYQAIRRNAGAVIRALRTLEAGHARGGTAHYYAIRDGRFNPARARSLARAPGPDGDVAYSPALAAMLIYLNRTGFNGLFRMNRQGRFNVPAGRYARPRICDAGNLQVVASALRRPAVRVRFAPFERALEDAGPCDFVYLDPPYAPVSATARFTSYTAEGFGLAEQVRLQQAVIVLVRRGCHVLLSNSVADAIADLYERNAEATSVGLRTWRVPARRAINSATTRRGPVTELIVTNILPASAPSPHAPATGPTHASGSHGRPRSLGVN
jgi:DNA adenine methylase